jgi:hypothetical protein
MQTPSETFFLNYFNIRWNFDDPQSPKSPATSWKRFQEPIRSKTE